MFTGPPTQPHSLILNYFNFTRKSRRGTFPESRLSQKVHAKTCTVYSLIYMKHSSISCLVTMSVVWVGWKWVGRLIDLDRMVLFTVDASIDFRLDYILIFIWSLIHSSHLGVTWNTSTGRKCNMKHVRQRESLIGRTLTPAKKTHSFPY